MPAKKKNRTQEASEQTEKIASGKENDGEEISLEEAFNMLDEITRSLEKEDISLEDSFSAYKKGMDLLKICNDKIDQVEKKVLVLNEEGGLDEF
ncbi:MAG TPA: exodeoxyribonuclease VII small subunit [Candidatus Eisenbergiella stercoravium]|nr:exodeoxyribonuclease VII small subunit [Candidatus Eisenbergiella stercoravium]